MEIRNADQKVRATTYWGTEHARRGYLYLSFNGGALRVLVPEPAAGVLGGTLERCGIAEGGVPSW